MAHFEDFFIILKRRTIFFSLFLPVLLFSACSDGLTFLPGNGVLCLVDAANDVLPFFQRFYYTYLSLKNAHQSYENLYFERFKYRGSTLTNIDLIGSYYYFPETT